MVCACAQIQVTMEEESDIISKCSCVRRYHAGKDVQMAAIYEELLHVCQKELGKLHDVYAKAVMKDGAVVGH